MSSNSSGGWLVDQLPRPMAEDDFTRRLVGIFEEIATDFRERGDSFAHQLDAGLAAPEFVRWTAGWLGLRLDADLDDVDSDDAGARAERQRAAPRQRAVLRAAGELFRWRGTVFGLQGMLEALTDAPVAVEDGGGVFLKGKAPPNGHLVTITLTKAEGLKEQRLLEMLRDEVPADARVVLRVGRRTVKEQSSGQQEVKPDAPAAAADASTSAPKPPQTS